MDSVNSTTFIKRPPCVTDKQKNILFTKEILTNRLFLGFYQEKRYVNELKEYRDVVVISDEEIDLHRDLDKVRKKWIGATDIKWVGITGPDVVGTPRAYCFWVKFSNLAFGSYWFQIKHVKLGEEEILLQLKCIRKSLSSQAGFSQVNFEKQPHAAVDYDNAETIRSRLSADELGWEFDPIAVFATLQNIFRKTVHIIRPHLTLRNLFTTLKVSCALVMALIFGCISCVGSLGEFVLKFIRELSILIHAFSPIIIKLIDFSTKIIGGLFILFARMMGGRGQGHVYMGPYPNNNFRSIPYSSLTKSFSQAGVANWRKRNKILRQELLSNPSAK